MRATKCTFISEVLKTTMQTGTIIAAALVCALAFTTAHGADAPKMKMTTDIPSSITIPDEVPTRLGTLKFTDGFPDDATVQKVYDNLDFQHAVQAYLTGLPAVSIQGGRLGLTGLGPANQTVAISETLLDSKSLFLTANTTTPYTVVWLDLTNGPLVMEVPPMILGPLDDAGSAGSPMSASRGRTRARAGNICCCRPVTRDKFQTVILSRVRAPLNNFFSSARF